MNRPLVYYNNPLLRKKCDLITSFGEETKKLIQDLIETMKASNGAGLAAPQIGVCLQAFVICYVGDDDEGGPLIGEPLVYCNPEIIAVSEKSWITEEGCLSIPQVRSEVERPWEIEIQARDRFGNLFKERSSGWKARAIQHEFDHLQGVLFIDRLPKRDRKHLEKDLQKVDQKFYRKKTT